MTWREIGHQEAGHFQLSDLKICELCGTLNLAANDECFVCSWHGEFDRRPEVIRIAVEVMERRHGRLDPDLLTSPYVHRHLVPGGLQYRLFGLLARMRHWFFG